MDIAEYQGAHLIVYVVGKGGGVNATLRPYVQGSPNGNLSSTAGNWVTLKMMATFAAVTGIKIAAASPLTRWARVGWTIAGSATAAFKFQGWLVAQGRY
jgi:hypothetical protein